MTRRVLVIGAVVAVAAATPVVVLELSGGGRAHASVPTATARRGDIVLTVGGLGKIIDAHAATRGASSPPASGGAAASASGSAGAGGASAAAGTATAAGPARPVFPQVAGRRAPRPDRRAALRVTRRKAGDDHRRDSEQVTRSRRRPQVYGTHADGRVPCQSAARRAVSQFVDDLDWRVRLRAVERLAGPGAPQALAKAVRDVDFRIRVAAVRLLAGYPGDRVGEILAAALDDDFLWTRVEAARALANRGDTRFVPELIALLRRKGDRTGSMRITAIEALAKLGDPRAVEPLAALLQRSRSVRVRRAVADALGALNDDRAVAALTAALTDTHQFVNPLLGSYHRPVAQAAARALDRIASEDARRTLATHRRERYQQALVLTRAGRNVLDPVLERNGFHFELLEPAIGTDTFVLGIYRRRDRALALRIGLTLDGAAYVARDAAIDHRFYVIAVARARSGRFPSATDPSDNFRLLAEDLEQYGSAFFADDEEFLQIARAVERHLQEPAPTWVERIIFLLGDRGA